MFVQRGVGGDIVACGQIIAARLGRVPAPILSHIIGIMQAVMGKIII
jgi:hypothetical protein